MTIEELRAKLERKKGRQEQLEKDMLETKEKINRLQQSIFFYEQSKKIVQQVGLKTQQQLSYNISEIASLALNSVLEDPYDVVLEFVERRNKTECDIYFERNKIKIDPFSGGGGALDIAAFALRVASWSMQRPRTRNVLILDEPFKHLKGEEANRRTLLMVKEISKRLKIQIIMVSDERVSREATVGSTDRLFETRIERGKTKVERI